MAEEQGLGRHGEKLKLTLNFQQWKAGILWTETSEWLGETFEGEFADVFTGVYRGLSRVSRVRRNGIEDLNLRHTHIVDMQLQSA